MNNVYVLLLYNEAEDYCYDCISYFEFLTVCKTLQEAVEKCKEHSKDIYDNFVINELIVSKDKSIPNYYKVTISYSGELRDNKPELLYDTYRIIEHSFAQSEGYNINDADGVIYE